MAKDMNTALRMTKPTALNWFKNQDQTLGG